MSQLPSDCLNEIFVYLDDDKISLYSCLLVNRLWCEVAVRILWRSIWNYNKRTYNILISCLPNEILSKNGIITSTSTLKPPLFNYVKLYQLIKFMTIFMSIFGLFININNLFH